jgi:hypothetical protein
MRAAARFATGFTPVQSRPIGYIDRSSINGGAMSEQEQPEVERNQGEPAAPEGMDPALLKRAMKAFRKRLKLTKLDEESKLGRSPLTGGKKSSVVAIMAPYGYPPEVWQELVRQGKLKDTGRGFFELIE